jgi:glyoxylase-like metal-dependent hydrolase (beta-lactamase superfamily II)
VKAVNLNTFIVDPEHDGLVLIDTGTPADAEQILGSIADLGREPADVRHILVTHCHVDHAGGLAKLKDATGAPAYMHPTDAEMVRSGQALRPFTRTPGVLDEATFRQLFSNPPSTQPATEVEREVLDGETLDLAGGMRAIHVPGHCAGQLAFLWTGDGSGGVLFAADAAANVGRLSLSPTHEDVEAGKCSAARLAGLDFEVACFGHGQEILHEASARFEEAFGASTADPTAG